MGKRFAILTGAAAACVMTLGATASAGVVKYDTKLTIAKDRGHWYHGWVQSDRDRSPEYDPANAVRKCMEGRRVVLFQRRPRADRKLGTDRSEFEPRHKGLWGLVLDRSYGHDVYAKVTRKERDRFVCRADRSPTIWIRRRSLGVSALGAQTEAAEAKTFTYTSKYTSASTANGYPSPGGIAELVGSPGSMKLKPGGDSGDLIDHLTITEQLAPNKFAFKGKGIDNFGGGEENSGKLHHKFKGTTTVQGDGSQQLAIEGHWTWGHVDFAPLVAGGRYHGASGHYKGSATVAPESGVIVGSSKGKLRMHH